jgi:hypothetical protein
MRLLRPLLVLGAACTLVVSLSGQTVRVLSVSGEATLQAPGDSAPRVVKKGDTIVIGTKIVTGEGARVILTPLPGVNSIIAPKSEIVVERVSVSNPAGAKTALHSAVLDLKTGAVTTDLKREEGVELDFGVRTARGLAGARGTTYTVAIDIAGVQAIIVADGAISLTLADGRVIDLVPGQISVTHPDGSTETVTSASQLSTGDQALAEDWIEATLDALAEAVEQGVDIDPAALEDAIRAAQELGVIIDVDTQSRLDGARDLLVERRLQARLDILTDENRTDRADARDIIAEIRQSLEDPRTPLPDDAYIQAREAFRAALTEARLAAFDALPDDVQRSLVTVNQSFFTAYGLDPYGDGQSRPVAAIRYAGKLNSSQLITFIARPEEIQDLLVSHPSDTGLRDYALTPNAPESYPDAYLVTYFKFLGSGQRSAFRHLDATRQGSLAEINDPGLTAYALAAGRTTAQVDYAIGLPAETRPLFFSFPADVQSVLVNKSDDTALAGFAYATNEGGGNLHSHAAILFYAGLEPSDRSTFEIRPANLQELAATNSEFAALLLARDSGVLLYSDATLAHYLTLPAGQVRQAYLARPADIRDQLASVGKPGLTAAILSDSTFKSPPSDGDLRRNLDALLALSPENQALFETFAGGPTYSKLGSTPGPYDWSDAAWTRTRNSFTALPSATQARILGLGATEGLFDYSATFIEAAFGDYDNTLSATTRSAIQEAGWGRHFADYFAREEFRELLAGAADLSAGQRATVREFGISPHAFAKSNSTTPTASPQATTEPPSRLDPLANLSHLATLSSADRALLAKLSPGDGILFLYGQGYYDEGTATYVYPTYAELISDALSLARSFDATQLRALRDLDLGHQLLNYAAQGTIWVGDSATPVRDRFEYILGLYSGLDAAQQDLARDLGLFSSLYLGDMRLDAASLGSALATLSGLNPKTRDFLASQHDGLPLFDLATGATSSGVYTLAEIDGLLSSLSHDDLATLRELRPGSALFRGYSNDGGLIGATDLKAFLAFVRDDLDDLQRFTLNELGITSHSNERKGLFLSDHEGLARLLQAYSELPATLRVQTRQLDSYDTYSRSFGGRSFFFASDDGYDTTSYDVSFSSPGDLHVGAVRRLALFRSGSGQPVTFQVPGDREHDIYLRASTLIDLNGVAFAERARAIKMEAATINLANLDFPEGAVVSLNSKLGGTGTNNRYPNFDGTSIPGRVNFLYNVSYGGAQNIMNSEGTFDLHSRGNIVIGTLQNPASFPTYTPPAPAGLQSIAQ